MMLQLKIVTSDDEYIEKSRARRTLVKMKDILSSIKESNGPVISNGTKLPR